MLSRASAHEPPTPPTLPYTTLFRSPRRELEIGLSQQRLLPEDRLRVLRDRRVRLLELDLDDRARAARVELLRLDLADRKSTRLYSSHLVISYAVFCLINKTRYYRGR